MVFLKALLVLKVMLVLLKILYCPNSLIISALKKNGAHNMSKINYNSKHNSGSLPEPFAQYSTKIGMCAYVSRFTKKASKMIH